MRSTGQYLDLIEPQHADKPNFVATVALTVDVFARLQTFIASIPAAFDLDTAVGAQLDANGERVGRSRNIPVPLPNLFFSWDDPIRGWDRGVWKGPYDSQSGISVLDDETYRRLLRAKILANSWDGTTDGQQAILNAFFVDPTTMIVAIDDTGAAYPGLFFTWDDPARGWDVGAWRQPGYIVASLPTFHPHMTILVAGKLPSILDLALLGEGYVAAKPSGVTLDYVVTSVDQTSVFGFDVSNAYISGWDSGSWGVAPAYIAEHAI